MSQPKQAALADSIKVSKEEKEPSVSASEIDNLSTEELGDLLRKRKDQYWNLANYINKEMMKNLDKTVKNWFIRGKK